MARELGDEADEVFRFGLAPADPDAALTLQEFYRRTVLDLLQIVRLFSNGKPVIVDSFAFLNEPEKQIKILCETFGGGQDGATG
jgi:hypothetical protein